MNTPTLSLIPMHGAIAADRAVTLDILIKIEPPEIERSREGVLREPNTPASPSPAWY